VPRVAQVVPETLRDAEVSEDDAAVGARHEVSRLDIAVDDAAGVNLAQRARGLGKQRTEPAARSSPGG